MSNRYSATKRCVNDGANDSAKHTPVLQSFCNRSAKYYEKDIGGVYVAFNLGERTQSTLPDPLRANLESPRAKWLRAWALELAA